MTRASWNHLVLGAVTVPLAGVAIGAVSMFLPGSENRGGSILAYAIATMALGAGLGGVGCYLSSRASSGPRIPGALAALAGAMVVSVIAASIRFRQTGATGFLSLAALAYTAELMMLAGLIPAVLVLGAGVARRSSVRGIGAAIAWSLAAGAVTAILIGPALILIRVLGRVPFLNPVVIWVLLTLAMAGFAWRRIDSNPTLGGLR